MIRERRNLLAREAAGSDWTAIVAVLPFGPVCERFKGQILIESNWPLQRSQNSAQWRIFGIFSQWRHSNCSEEETTWTFPPVLLLLNKKLDERAHSNHLGVSVWNSRLSLRFYHFCTSFFCFVWLRFIVYRLLVDNSDRYMNGTFCTCLIGGIDYETITPFEWKPEMIKNLSNRINRNMNELANSIESN